MEQAPIFPSGIEIMLTRTAPEPNTKTAFAGRYSIAVANAHLFRKLAWRALRDGQPNGALRAANARAAARIVLKHAKRDALVYQLANEALKADPTDC